MDIGVDTPGENESLQPTFKRPRTTLACQRCKTRKQKCDGGHPECLQCMQASSACRYVSSTVPKPSEQRVYVKALEARVAELESRLTYVGGSGVANDHWETSQQAETAESSLSRTIRELSLNASGYSYLGGTSNITLARLIGPVLHNDRSQKVLEDLNTGNESSNDPLVTRIFPQPETEDLSNIPLFTETVVDTLFEAYIRHVSTQYPVIHSRKLRDMHSRRSKPRGIFEVCVLHLVYAIGGITLELCGQKGNFKHEEHYEAAMAHRSKMLRCINRREIRFLALTSMYCLRSPRNPGPWTMMGLAIKLCTSLGLHRKSCTSRFGLGSELDRRLFWTCYALDRDITLTMGRPPSICDHDIDAPLPLEVDEDSINPEDFRRATKNDPSIPANPPTTLTYHIHTLRLKRIVSDIQHTVYRVDKTASDIDAITNSFVNELNEWKLRIPNDHSQRMKDPTPPTDKTNPSVQIHLRDSYMIEYHSSLRFLLFPRLTEDSPNPRFFNIGVEACTGVCKSIKQLYQQSTTTYFPPLSTTSLFLAGLTLMYCMWNSRDASIKATATDALTDCTIMLYVMAERWPKAKKYRIAFERLKTLVLDHVEKRSLQISVNMAGLENETRVALDSIGQDFGGFGMSAYPNTMREEQGSLWEDEEFELEYSDEFYVAAHPELYNFDSFAGEFTFADTGS